MLLKGVLFDIDDTLFDRLAAEKLSLQLLVAKHPGLLGPISPEKLQSAWLESDDLSTADFNSGKFARVLRCRYFLKLLDLPQTFADELTEQYLSGYPHFFVPLPGALELVHYLKDRLKVGVISNSLADVQYAKLRTLGLYELMSCVVLSEELGIRKPDPAIFHYASGLLGVPSSGCLFVGDSWPSDIAGARAAGMLACWLNIMNLPPPDNPPVRPNYIVRSLSELVPLLINDALI